MLYKLFPILDNLSRVAIKLISDSHECVKISILKPNHSFIPTSDEGDQTNTEMVDGSLFMDCDTYESWVPMLRNAVEDDAKDRLMWKDGFPVLRIVLKKTEENAEEGDTEPAVEEGDNAQVDDAAAGQSSESAS